MKTVFIGVGNTFRQDDGIGIYIVRKLKEKFNNMENIAFAESHGEGASLMNLWCNYSHAVLFDAVMYNGDVGKRYHLEASAEHIPGDFFKYSSHAFSLAEAVELARVLDRLPEKIEIYGVEGKNFKHGEGFTEAVKQAGDQIINELTGKNWKN